MKKILSLTLLLFMMLAAILLSGCSGTKEELLALQTLYIGNTVTDTQHTFTPADFQVTAIYTNNKSEEITDFTVEVKELKNSCYTVLIKWNDWEEECYVPLEMKIYASEMES